MQHIKHNTANLANQLCKSTLLITFSFVWTVNFCRFSVFQTSIRVSFKNRAIYFVYYYHVTIIFTIKPANGSLSHGDTEQHFQAMATNFRRWLFCWNCMKIVSCRHIHINISKATVLKRTAHTAYNLMIGCSEKDYITMLQKCCLNVATRSNFTKTSNFVASNIFFVAGNKQQNQIDLCWQQKFLVATRMKFSGDANILRICCHRLKMLLRVPVALAANQWTE